MVPNLFGIRDRFFLEGNSSVGLVEGMVLGWFKCITFIVHFISNRMPLMIWREMLVFGLEVGDPCNRGGLGWSARGGHMYLKTPHRRLYKAPLEDKHTLTLPYLLQWELLFWKNPKVSSSNKMLTKKFLILKNTYIYLVFSFFVYHLCFFIHLAEQFICLGPYL